MWIVEAGNFQIMIGTSSEDVRFEAVFILISHEYSAQRIRKQNVISISTNPFSSQ